MLISLRCEGLFQLGRHHVDAPAGYRAIFYHISPPFNAPVQLPSRCSLGLARKCRRYQFIIPDTRRYCRRLMTLLGAPVNISNWHRQRAVKMPHDNDCDAREKFTAERAARYRNHCRLLISAVGSKAAPRYFGRHAISDYHTPRASSQ